MNEHDTIESIGLPSASRGDVAMLSRVEQRLFGDSAAQVQHLGHYQIIERRGMGGMGVVYAAHDPKLERKVALKILRSGVVAERGRDRLIAEARTLAKLSHANVVQVHGVDIHEDEVYVVMELVDGHNLAVWQQASRDLGELLAVYLEAGAGLAAAHEAGVVHRDFKPANVLIGSRGEVKVADFGLASSAMFDTETDSRLTGSGRTVEGTRGYIAPELWQGQPADPRSDQFAFCVSLWEAVVGELPFARDEIPTDQPRGSWPGPAWLRRVLARGMRANPGARWPSMDALLDRLRHTPGRRRRIGASAIGVGLLAGLLFGLPESTGSTGCADGDELGIWTPDELSELETKLGDHREPGGAASAAALVGELAGYRRRWELARSQVCEDHHESRTLSASGFDRARVCLARSRARALVIRDPLSSAPPGEAARLVGELDDPQACLDRTPGADHQSFASASALALGAVVRERELAALRVAIARGQLDWARTQARELAERPGDAGTEALVVLGRVQREAGERDQARQSLLEANRRAALASAPTLSFASQLALAELGALEFDNALDARSWLSQAETSWLALGQPVHAGLELRYTEALTHAVEGRPEQARASLRELVDGLEAVDAEPRRVSRARLALANATANTGDHDEAMRIYAELLDEQARRLGAEHPSVGILAFDIADSLVQVERWGEALPLLERALTIETQAYGARSLRVAQVQTRLAEVEVERGAFARASTLARAAWATQQRELTPKDEGYGAPLGVLAWADLQAEQWADADASYRAVLATFELDREDRAATHQTLAWLSCRREPRCVGARADLERVRELAEPGSLVRLRAEVVDADIALLDGDAALARDRALAVLAQLARLEPGVDPELAAEAEALAGLALAALSDRAAARLHLMNASALAADLVDDLEARSERALAAIEPQPGMSQ